MSRVFPELVVGGVLASPFVTYAGAALAVFLLLRPLLVKAGIERWFSAPPVMLLSLYVLILALLIALV